MRADRERKIVIKFKAGFIVESRNILVGQENGIHSVDRDGETDGKGLNIFMIFCFRAEVGGSGRGRKRERVS